MDRNSDVYRTYVRILERELVCAMGCTEPIALAYCAAKARAVLEALPGRIGMRQTDREIIEMMSEYEKKD